MKQAIYSGDVEKDVYYGSEKSVPEFEENIAERAKVRRQKNLTTNNHDTTDMRDLEKEESAEQRRMQKGQGLKILTPDKTLSRFPITLAPLKAENNSEKLKNEIR